MPDTYVTPCVKICRINSISKLCEGCGRTRHEIANWIYYSDNQRQIIMHRIIENRRKNKHIIVRVFE